MRKNRFLDKKKLWFAGLALLCSLILAACGEGATATSQPTTVTPAGSPTANSLANSQLAALLNNANTTFYKLQSLHMLLEIQQGKVEVNGIQVTRIDSDLQQPDKYQATVKVNTVFGSFDLPVIGLDGKQYQKGDFGGWGTSSDKETVNLAILFDQKAGLGATLLKMQNPQLIGTESIDGNNASHVQGQVAAADIGAFTYNKLGSHPVTLDAWISQDNSHVLQLYLHETGTGDGLNFWIFHFSKFDEPLTIQKPKI